MRLRMPLRVAVPQRRLLGRVARPAVFALVIALATTTNAARAADAPGYSPQGADSCLGCHGDTTVTGLFRTKHARPNDPNGPFGHGGLQCEACHGPGGAHVKAGGGPLAGMVDFGPKAPAPALKQNAQCLGCHQSNAAHDWATSAHAASDVACASCHTLHAAKDPVQTAATQIEVCTTCHQAQHTDLFKPSHHPLREGKMACTSCHSPHGSTAPAQLVKNTVTETCTDLSRRIPRAVSVGAPAGRRGLHQLSRSPRFRPTGASQDASAISLPDVP